jgi:hypothetical protein
LTRRSRCRRLRRYRSVCSRCRHVRNAIRSVCAIVERGDSCVSHPRAGGYEGGRRDGDGADGSVGKSTRRNGGLVQILNSSRPAHRLD